LQMIQRLMSHLVGWGLLYSKLASWWQWRVTGHPGRSEAEDRWHLWRCPDGFLLINWANIICWLMRWGPSSLGASCLSIWKEPNSVVY
jgi:hypothetical protein